MEVGITGPASFSQQTATTRFHVHVDGPGASVIVDAPGWANTSTARAPQGTPAMRHIFDYSFSVD
jgi:hypothetical protein